MNRLSNTLKITFACALLILSWTTHSQECSVRVGEYSGTVKAEWLTKTREMKLLEPFAFKGPDCKVWPVPKGAIVDGASIPKIFWSVIGGPFEGRYRDASVVHDYYCKVQSEPSDEVHEMFYNAMLANGVDSIKAGLMFYAVSWYGPRWQLVRKFSLAPGKDSGPIYSAPTLRVLTDEELRPNSKVISLLAKNVGQPSPFEKASMTSKPFQNRMKSTYETNNKWLITNGIEVTSTPATDTEALENIYQKKPRPTVFNIASPDLDEKYRLLSWSPPLPTQADVERITKWINHDKPSLLNLKNTPLDKVPVIRE